MARYNAELIERFFGSLDPAEDKRTLPEIRAEIVEMGGTEDEANEAAEIVRALRLERFGSVMIDGEEYALTSQADYTNRLFPNNNYHEADTGEEYVFEMSATAISPNDEPGAVYWIFTATKGAEPELDTIDYSEADRFVEA